MKKLLTIVVCGQPGGERCDALYSGVELIYAEKSLLAAVKQAKGKYILIESRTFSFKDFQPFLSALDTATQDIVRFNGGNVYNSKLFKGIADFGDGFVFTAFAAFNAKTVAYFGYAPFTFSQYEFDFEKENSGLKSVCAEFKRVKAKLLKEVYSFTFDLICERLLFFYTRALISVYEKKLSADKLTEFDKKLKEEIVLYLALDKRFDGGALPKIRGKGFKISYFTYRRFKKKFKDA